MEYNRKSTKEKWTIMMYMRHFDLMATYAYAMRMSSDLSTDNIEEILAKMANDEIYRPRNGGSTFTGQFKYIQICWYLFGYYNNSKRHVKTKKMIFSPLGNLLLDNIKDKQKTSKIFMTMLHAIGFRHPFSQMDQRFNIYPFRLMFQLLRDPRLDFKIYNDEMFYLTMFLKTITPEEYEQLVADILELRRTASDVKMAMFLEDECVVGLACHEWRYMTGMLESAGIVTKHNEHGNRVVGKLGYGKKDAKGRYSVYRNYREDYITVNAELLPLLDKLLANYPYHLRPHSEDGSGGMDSSSSLAMYLFYPMELLEELKIDIKGDGVISTMLQLTDEVSQYFTSEMENPRFETSEDYKYAFNEVFKMFSDLVTERTCALPTDIECVYCQDDDVLRKRFDVEIDLLLRRSLSHLQKTFSERKHIRYTIIMSFDYDNSVLQELKKCNAVLLKPSVFIDYLRHEIVRHGRNISFSTLDRLIEENMGKDISEELEDYIRRNFEQKPRKR